jgi:hypothetical protein
MPVENFIQSITSKSSLVSGDDNLPFTKSVIVKVKDQIQGGMFKEDYFITYSREDFSIPTGEHSKPFLLSGIEIQVTSSLGKYSTTPPFHKLKHVVNKSFRLLTLAFQESFENISEEDKELYSDEDFFTLKSALQKLGVGEIIDFIFYYNTTITPADEYNFQKNLPSIFSDPEKVNFIRTGSEKVDTKSDFSDFILLYNKSIISSDVLSILKELLEKSVVHNKFNYKNFTSPNKKEDEEKN